jgi:hypothetical protein
MFDESSTTLARRGEEINRLSKRVEELERRNQALEVRNQEQFEGASMPTL